MGYALRRPNDDDDVRPAKGLGILGHVVERIKRLREAFHMNSVQPRFSAPVAAIEVGKMGRLVQNWDGHGGEAVPADARRDAVRFLQRAEGKFGASIPAPTVGAVGGGVVFVWRAAVRPGAKTTGGEREIEIAFYRDGKNEWSVSDRDGIDDTKSGENVDEDFLLRLIDRFVVD